MGKIKRYKNRVERFLSGESGQRFFNFAYSIGAAVVIWGALFKILHLPGGNTLLAIGMGTEVLMFILTAFDRPPREYNWEEVFPVLDSHNPDERPDLSSGEGVNVVVHGTPAVPASHEVAVAQPAPAPALDLSGAAFGEVSEQYVAQMAGIAEQMSRLRQTTEALNEVSETLLTSYRAITENSENITQSSTGYVEQMQNLNRNISGLNTIYEIQLKSVSSQLDAIDRVNRGIKDICAMYENTASASSRYCEESEKMARYMAQLNQVYAKMLHAMTINMQMPGAPIASAPSVEPEAGEEQQ
ncbi:MAG: gliding motility protein GldL [Bacteroides sp.]|nr:gliding motility protein GldL [Bacteroides sp.]MCM1414000.1 gliding motility protein GldL [Bacteroides sp.]MCM1472305.1 gliding motility protein GldL [Bacteroides sp.]